MDIVQSKLNGIMKSAQTDPRFKQYGEVEVTPGAKDYTNRVFKSLLPHFPAWRQSCPTPEDLGRLKNAWTKAIMRHELKTGKQLNVKAGLLACEESDSDWLPSVGKFIKWCDQSGDLELTAQKALDLFNRGQSQIESVGQMVVSKHGFDLKRLNASETKKQFISLYLTYAEDNAIKPLEAFALAETVQLSPEQQKDADKRCETAQNECLNHLHGLFGRSEPKKVIDVIKPTGIKTGKVPTSNKSKKQMESERDRQLKAAGLKL